jgi:hypothetical protein
MIVRFDRAARRFTAFGDSLPDVDAYLRGTKPVWRIEKSRTSSPTDAWDLSAGWYGALTLARNGWSDGARELHELLSAADIQNKKAHVERWGVAGYAPDVPRYLAGDPSHMRRRSRSPDVTHKPIVSIIYNITANHNVSAKSLALMGSAMAAIIDQLENKGRRVDLSCAFVSENFGRAQGKVVSGWRVKRAEDHLDLASVAFSIAHPAAMRRLCLAICERSPYDFQDGCYGHARHVRPGDLPDADVDALIVQGLAGSGSARPSSVLGAVNYLAGQVNAAAGFDLIETKVQL